MLHPDGRYEVVDVERWVVSIPMLKARLRVEPLVREQEVVSPIGVHKYEGASKVVGQIEGNL
jgi:hypothetical protein